MVAADVCPQAQVPLAPLTTLGVGGPAQWYLRAVTLHDVLGAVRWAGERGLPLTVLGGGSNVVIADEGLVGLVLQIDLRGCDVHVQDGGVRLDAAAGEPWDAVVARSVEHGLAGLECLSGIPGSVGGTPVQNVGAYGQEVSRVITRVTAVDRQAGRVVQLGPEACAFGYRTSRFKTTDRDRFIVTAVQFQLGGGPVETSYPDVDAWLQNQGRHAPGVADVREAVLAVRRRKGMVVDAADVDTHSAGSFFVNPIVSATRRDALALRSAEVGRALVAHPVEGGFKVPAAWLIQLAGLRPGFRMGPAGLSSKHPLAIINGGGASARAIIGLAAHVKRKVIESSGFWLQAEPELLGCEANDEAVFLRQTGE